MASPGWAKAELAHMAASGGKMPSRLLDCRLTCCKAVMFAWPTPRLAWLICSCELGLAVVHACILLCLLLDCELVGGRAGGVLVVHAKSLLTFVSGVPVFARLLGSPPLARSRVNSESMASAKA